MFRATCALFALFGSSLVESAHAQSVADFYRSKTVNVWIGYGAGGGYDLSARVLARHMGRHIPGEPTLVPRNMPGAGSLTLANWLYSVAPKDGLDFGIFGRTKARGQHMGRKPKLTQHQRTEAMQRRDRGENMREIAASYNVSHSTISSLAQEA